jgi:hypothetical protein
MPAIRLTISSNSETERVAKAEGTTLNQSINLAVAEKRSALRTAEYFKERAARADIGQALELLDRVGDEAPREGDEIAPDLEGGTVNGRAENDRRMRPDAV